VESFYVSAKLSILRQQIFYKQCRKRKMGEAAFRHFGAEPEPQPRLEKPV